MVRVWINDFASSTGNFGDFSAGNNLFADINNAAVDICSTRENGLSTRNSAKDGNYDVLNFLWYKGAEILYVNSSGKKILISSFTSYFLSTRPDMRVVWICEPYAIGLSEMCDRVFNVGE